VKGIPNEIKLTSSKGVSSPFNEDWDPVAFLPVRSPKLRGWHAPCKTNS